MKNYNDKNEKIKHGYFIYLKEGQRLCESTIDSARKALNNYESFTKLEDFGKFNNKRATAFKNFLMERISKSTGKPLSKSTILQTLNLLKDFFNWLVFQDGYKSKIKRDDIQYLRLSEKETREAKSIEYKEAPTIEQIKHVLSTMQPVNEIEKRNQALIAFTLLTGIRDGAIITLKMKHIDLDIKLVKQDPREVKTKFSKRIDTYFFPVGDDVENIMIEWVKYLREVKLFGDNAPLFPKTKLVQDEHDSFISAGLSEEHWQSVTPLRDIFKQAFSKAGLKYYNPHSFRNTIVQHGQRICKVPEDFKAWSQNLGHESPLTTFISYGYINTHRQGQLIKEMGKNDYDKPVTIRDIRELLGK